MELMELTDGVIRLRPYQGNDDDIERALQWYRDPEVLYYSEGPGTEPFTRDRVVRMYSYLASHGQLYIIEVKTPDGWQPIGDVTLAEDTMPIVIGDAQWRSRGIGSRVLPLVIQRARDLGWTELQAKHIWTDNVRSQRLFTGCGFVLTESGIDKAGRSFHRYQLTL